MGRRGSKYQIAALGIDTGLSYPEQRSRCLSHEGREEDEVALVALVRVDLVTVDIDIRHLAAGRSR